MEGYLDVLRRWEAETLFPAVYEALPTFFPSMGFVRRQAGSPKDHWASPLKIDGTRPKVPTREKTVVYGSENRFREQGDWNNSVSVSDMLMKSFGVPNIYELDLVLSSRLGLVMPKAPSKQEAAGAVSQRTREDILEELGRYFFWHLWNSQDRKAGSVRSYLKRVRGFGEEAAKELGFGFVPEWSRVIGFMTRKGYRYTDVVEACDVADGRGRSMVGSTHVLSIPYRSGGVIRGFIFRRVDSDADPKYMVNRGLDRKSAFFNIPKVAEDIVVVEGEMDALSLTAAGVPGVVSIGGSELSGERRRQVEDALRRGVRRIFLCLDLDLRGDGTSDAPGRFLHTMRSVHTVRDVDFSLEDIRVVVLPEPGDPDSFVRAHGPASFVELLRTASPYWEYEYRYRMQNGRSLPTAPVP